MVSQQPSRASLEIRRSMSMTSIPPQRSQEHFAGFQNEAAAYENAVTAAGRALMSSSEGLHGQIRTQNPVEADHEVSDVSAPGLCKRQSIRFAGSNAVPLRSHSVRSFQRSIYHHPGSNQPETAQDFVQGNCGADSQVTDFHCFKPAKTTTGANDQRPSYETIRIKAPSSCAEGAQEIGADSAAGRHLRRGSVRSSEGLRTSEQPHVPRRHKSLSSLRGFVNGRSTGNRMKTEQVPTFRSGAEVARPKLNPKRSILSLGRQKVSQYDLRRSARTQHSSTPDDKDNSITRESDRERTRNSKLSVKNLVQSFRFKLGKALGRSRGSHKSLPLQHLQASRAHFGGRVSSSEGVGLDYALISPSHVTINRRDSSNAPLESTSSVLVNRQISDSNYSSTYSNENLSGDRTRVTSWADSTATNAVSPPPHAEAKRLSVIAEDSSFLRPTSGPMIASIYQDITHMPPQQPDMFKYQHMQQALSHVSTDYDEVIAASSSLEVNKHNKAAMARSSDVQSLEKIPLSTDYQYGGIVLRDVENMDVYRENVICQNRPRFETGSTMFPTDTRIEQARGPSPFRISRASQVGNPSVSSFDNQQWPARESLPSLKTSPAPHSYHSQNCQSPSIYSQPSPEMRDMNSDSQDSVVMTSLRKFRAGKAIISTPGSRTHLGANHREKAQIDNESEDGIELSPTVTSPRQISHPGCYDTPKHGRAAPTTPIRHAGRVPLIDITSNIVGAVPSKTQERSNRAGTSNWRPDFGGNSAEEIQAGIGTANCLQKHQTGNGLVSMKFVGRNLPYDRIGSTNHVDQGIIEESEESNMSLYNTTSGFPGPGLRMEYERDPRATKAIRVLPENQPMIQPRTTDGVEAVIEKRGVNMDFSANPLLHARRAGATPARTSNNQSAAFI